MTAAPNRLNKRAYITEDTNNTNISFFNFVTFEIIYAVVPLMTAVDLLTLFLRAASLRERRARPQADDYSAILACIFAIGTGVIVIYGAVQRVTGRHDWDPWPPPEGPWPKSDYTYATKDTDHPVFGRLYQTHVQVNYALNCLQGVGIGVVRLAFLFLFRKLFAQQGRRYILLVDTLIILVTLFMLANTGVSVFVCGGYPQAQWTNHELAAQHCFKSNNYDFGVNAGTVFLDMTVFFIPMFPLYRVTRNMSNEKRSYILAVFCFGFLAVVSSIFSLILSVPFFMFQSSYIYTWLREHGAGDGDTFGTDNLNASSLSKLLDKAYFLLSWSGTTTFWAYMELSVGAAVCNMPIISRFLIRKWWNVSKRATLRTLNQVVTRDRRLFAHNHIPVPSASRSGDPPGSGSEGAETIVNSEPAASTRPGFGNVSGSGEDKSHVDEGGQEPNQQEQAKTENNASLTAAEYMV